MCRRNHKLCATCAHTPSPPLRYGVHQFLEVWRECGGSFDALVSTPDNADDMPGAELLEEEKQDFIDSLPVMMELEAEANDEVRNLLYETRRFIQPTKSDATMA